MLIRINVFEANKVISASSYKEFATRSEGRNRVFLTDAEGSITCPQLFQKRSRTLWAIVSCDDSKARVFIRRRRLERFCGLLDCIVSAAVGFCAESGVTCFVSSTGSVCSLGMLFM